MAPNLNFFLKATQAQPRTYTRVPDSDASDSDAEKQPFDLPTRKRTSKRLLYTTYLLLAALLGGSTHYFIQRLTSRPDVLTCGSTNEEALALGCILEPMVYGWMPAPCYFERLSSQYTPFEDRDWYTSNAYREEDKIPVEDLWAAKHEHIFTRQYHGEHCLFLWRKLNLAVDLGSKWLDHKTLDLKHTDHCVGELEDHGIEWRNASNDVVRGFYRCRRWR